jgi:hypothetical protein
MTKGDRVILTFGELVQVDGVVVLASPDARSLMVTFDDALVDGCIGMMPLLRDDASGTYHNIMTGHAIGVRPL